MNEGYISLKIRYEEETPIISTKIDGVNYEEFVKMVSRAMNSVVDSFSDGTDESKHEERVKLLAGVSKAMTDLTGIVVK